MAYLYRYLSYHPSNVKYTTLPRTPPENALALSCAHIPPLVVDIATPLGSLLPFFGAKKEILEFGLPARIASSKGARAIMGDLEEFDTVLMILGQYAGAVNAWVCSTEGVPGKAGFRGLSGACI
ncbi:hypothetical protein BDV11DRAFT_175718 [Aspergillus similis]